MFKILLTVFSLLLFLGATGSCSKTPNMPDDVIWTLKGQQTTILADKNRGAAIYSVNSNNFEYVVSTDRNGSPYQGNWYILGNLLQTAYTYNGQGEHNNPTEAGSADGTVSPVIFANINPGFFQSAVHPAYFYKLPNGQAISPDTITKRVTIDWNGIVNVIQHQIWIDIATPQATADIIGSVFYANPALSQLLVWNGSSWVLTPFKSAPTFVPALSISGTQPMIMTTPDGVHALGVYGPHSAYNMMSWDGPGVSTAQAISLTGERNPGGLSWHLAPANVGRYTTTVYYVVGTLAEVQAKIAQVMKLVPQS